MKRLARPVYLAFIVVVLLAACGPATPAPTPTPVTGSLKSGPVPILSGANVPPALGCVPPAPTVGLTSSYCVNPVKGLGGFTFSDTTNLQTDGTNSWLVADPIAGNVTCTLDNSTSTATCSGPAGATFTGMVCSSCTLPAATLTNNVVCIQGFVLNDVKSACVPVDQSEWQHWMFCPAGSHYDNALQNCVDDITQNLASPCPPDHPVYSPDQHWCLTKTQEVFDCQTFEFKIGVCPIPAAQAAIKVVPFCQNNDANQGGLNMLIPAGASLSVDVRANHLDSCTFSGLKSDGSQLLTCLGNQGSRFDGTLCTDKSNPTSCQAISETLGECAVKKAPEGGAIPPPCRGTIAVCP